MKTCFKCKEQKDDSEFCKNRNLCKKCNNNNVKHYYANNQIYKASIKAKSEKHKQKTIKMISDFKSLYGCLFCHEKDSCCLQFHHLNPSEKDFEIHGGSKRNVESYKKEIQKCEIVCANCHLKIHANKLHISKPRCFDLSLLVRKELVGPEGNAPSSIG